ncbi:MAG: cupin domain-containing protein [Gemmatimonadales bacterium]
MIAGELGQRYLASGTTLAMRLWDGVKPGEKQGQHQRDYETVGYIISGKAELHIEGQQVVLEPGDSWVIPKRSSHSY